MLSSVFPSFREPLEYPIHALPLWAKKEEGPARGPIRAGLPRGEDELTGGWARTFSSDSDAGGTMLPAVSRQLYGLETASGSTSPREMKE